MTRAFTAAGKLFYQKLPDINLTAGGVIKPGEVDALGPAGNRYVCIALHRAFEYFPAYRIGNHDFNGLIKKERSMQGIGNGRWPHF